MPFMNGSSGKAFRIKIMRDIMKTILLVVCLAGICWMAATKACIKTRKPWAPPAVVVQKRPTIREIGQNEPARVASLRKIIFSRDCAENPCQPSVSAESREQAIKEYVQFKKKYGGEIDLRNADLIDLDLSGVDLSSANLADAKLGDCSQYDLSSLHGYRGAKLEKANLDKANLLGACLCGANLRGANLEEAHCTQDQINSATGDQETRLPPEFDRPSGWSGVLAETKPQAL